MAINLAKKYETRTSDLVKARRKSKEFTNQDWSWDGVNAIVVTTLSDPTMSDYDPSAASNRYGAATEIEDTQQTFTLSRDRSWTKTIDKKNSDDALMIRQPGKYLAQATKNVLVPEIDTYLFQTLATTGAVYDRDDIATDAASSSSNAYTNFTLINANITDNEAPEEGRVAAMTATYYNYLLQGGFVLASDKGQGIRQSGNLGTVDGVTVVTVPSSRMPTTSGAIDLLISHPSALTAPEKLVDYTLHSNPVGISGQLLEYRHRYDGFVDVNAIYSIGMHAVA